MKVYTVLCNSMATNKTDAVRFQRLQITDEFDNRPGTGLFLRFSLAWSHSRIVRCPSSECKRRQGAVRAPYDSRLMLFYPQ